MPFKITTVPATFMRLITIVFSQMLYKACLVSLEEIIVFNRNHIKMLYCFDTTLERFGQANFKLRSRKCALEKTSVNLLSDAIIDRKQHRPRETLSHKSVNA